MGIAQKFYLVKWETKIKSSKFPTYFSSTHIYTQGTYRLFIPNTAVFGSTNLLTTTARMTPGRG